MLKPLNVAAIKDQLTPSRLKELFDIEVFTSLPSTNEYLKKHNKLSHGLICLAEQQTAGKGRHGKHWHSPADANIYFSCCWEFPCSLDQLNGISLVVGLALVSTFAELGLPQDLKIKWPNDIYWQGRKLAGILVEILASKAQQTRLIIGIGANINMLAKADNSLITQPWVSLAEILGGTQDRNKLIARILENLFHFLSEFEKNGLSGFLAEWQNYDFLYNKFIELEHNQIVVSGIARGVNASGQLLLQLPDNSIKAYMANEVSLRKNSLMNNQTLT